MKGKRRDQFHAARDAVFSALARWVEGRTVGPRILYVPLAHYDRHGQWLAAHVDDVTTIYLDQWYWELHHDSTSEQARVRAVCLPDLPEETFDTVVVSVSFQGEAELTREIIQQAHQRLAIGGWLWAVVDNPQDRWLAEQLEHLFGKVRPHKLAAFSCYECQKQGELRKPKEFWCEFKFRDQERLLWAYSRPGVFAHRRVDAGARRLLEAMQVQPTMRILEIGCGSGVISLAAAARQSTAQILAVDSASRSIQCVQRGAERNALHNITTVLYSRNDYRQWGRFDLIVTNPPYYGRFEIAKRFLAGAAEALAPRGELLLVTKQFAWYAENAETWFPYVRLEPVRGGYWILRAALDHDV